MPESPPECANCGAEIPAGSRACPECGADEHTGWRDLDIYGGLDLPDEDGAEAGASSGNPPSRELPWYWWATGIAVIIGFILMVMGAR